MARKHRTYIVDHNPQHLDYPRVLIITEDLWLESEITPVAYLDRLERDAYFNSTVVLCKSVGEYEAHKKILEMPESKVPDFLNA